MKTLYKKLLLLLLMTSTSIFAQGKLEGKVTDKITGQSLPGVNVAVKGSTNGVSTDFDGNYKLSKLNNGDIIVFTYLGFKEATLNYAGQKTFDVVLEEEASKLEEVVVIGYGSVKKKDATGSVDLITSKEFNKGPVVSVDQLLVGKAPGVRITNAGGAPDSAPNIRIRGGASLSAQNNPLIVIDGVPIDFVNAAGNNNPLALINPTDIESFSILKDASAAAIYGSRASNGVIIITTKKGTQGKPEFEFNSSVSIGKVQSPIEMMNGQQFADFVRLNYPGQTYLLGVDDQSTILVSNPLEDNPATPQIEGRILSNTNWQEVIYRDAVTTDNNFSARANLFGKIPFRASVGHTNAQGLVRTNDFERYTTSLKISPQLFDKHLKIDVNAKGLLSEKNAINQDGVFGSALNMNPTLPVFGLSPDNVFNGIYQNLAYSQILQKYLGIAGGTNPLAQLDQRRRPENIRKFLGNMELDYKLHFFPNLRAVFNLGIETSRSNIEEFFIGNAVQTYTPISSTNTFTFNPGTSYRETQNITNQTMDAYLVYTKELKGFIKKFDIQGGYNYQNFRNDGIRTNYFNNPTTAIREELIDNNNRYNRYFNTTNLQSFFGRTNIDFSNKYLFTASFRADGSSLFQEDNRWGYFPSAAFAWKVSEESFLKDSKYISSLKLRLGWGKTGNQDITQVVGYYPTSPLFSINQATSQYLPGFNSYSALPFDPALTWEKATTINVGVDFDLFKKNIISGSVDVFKREVNDLLARVVIPSGQFLTNRFVQNVGSIDGKGMETSLTIRPYQSDNWNIELNGNAAYTYNEVTDLEGKESVDADESGLPIGTGVRLARHALGFQPYSAWVFQQVYDAAGKPIQGAYVDKNNDNVINDDDRYYEALRPNWTFGFGTSVSYKNFDLNASFRGQVGGNVYNTRELLAGNVQRALPTSADHLNNVLASPILFTNNIGNVPLSDYFLEDASFVRCEAITLGYKNNKIIKNGSIRFYVSGNNLFLISKYSGQDPENFNAIDNNFYPRPQVYSFGVNVNF